MEFVFNLNSFEEDRPYWNIFLSYSNEKPLSTKQQEYLDELSTH